MGTPHNSPKEDSRPALRFWAPGNYENRCAHCGEGFLGAKGAMECANCVYDNPDTKVKAHA